MPSRAREILVVLSLLLPVTSLASKKIHSDTSRYPCIQGGDPVLSHSMKPNCSGLSVRGGLSATATYNQQGIRDRDFPAAPAKRTARILYAGGSVLVGPGLPQAKTPVKLIESKLSKSVSRSKSFRKVEVINGAVEGYFPPRVVIFAKRLIQAYAPQYVLMGVGGGDALFQTLIELHYSTAGANGEPESVRHPNYPRGYPAWLSDFLGTGFLVAKRMNGLAQFWAVARIGLKLRLMSDEKRRQYFMGRTIEQIRILQSAVEKGGGKFLLVWSPVAANTDYSPHPDTDAGPVNFAERLFVPSMMISPEEMRQALLQSGIPFVEAALPADPEYFLPNDWHLSPKGADAFSRVVAERIRAKWPELGR